MNPESADLRSRRDFLWQTGGGCGGLALSWLLTNDARAAGDKPLANPLAARPPHFPTRAKSMIFLFMVGGPSPLDLFDPKPAL
ncbi:MAG: twin-arginine translocation signal domain-containing protein, partial [Gemmataceae bacterium]